MLPHPRSWSVLVQNKANYLSTIPPLASHGRLIRKWPGFEEEDVNGMVTERRAPRSVHGILYFLGDFEGLAGEF